MDNQVIHNPEKKRFEWNQDGLTSMVEYVMGNNLMVFSHTEVPPALEGQGIAAKMAKFALDYARDQQLRILPLCPYIKAYIERHPEYKPLIGTNGHE